MTSSLHIPSLITVRAGSTRLPGKCFLSFGDGSVLEHIINRTLHYHLFPIVCTTTQKEDDQIAALANKLRIPCFRGAQNNKLLRWSECCNHFGLKSFHSIDADDPFFCGEEVRRSFALLQSGFDVIAPSPSSSIGGATVGYSLTYDSVKRSCEMLDENVDTEMIGRYLNVIPAIKQITLDDPSNYVVKSRMTLDYWEDYVKLESIRLILGNFASRSEVFKLLNANPDLDKINSFRTAEWSAIQELKSSPLS